MAMTWWNLIEEYSRDRARSPRMDFMDEIPDATPQEVQVDNRMDEIRSFVAKSQKTTLSALLGHFGNNALIVTLLALLELSRLGGIRVWQMAEWGEIEVEAG
jgi:segregation and condensation protein A